MTTKLPSLVRASLLLSSLLTGTLSVLRAAEPAAILESNCVSCHQPDGRAPFSLMGDEDLTPHLSAIREALNARTMPPGSPKAGFGSFRHHGLSERDRTALLHWVSQGAPMEEKDPAAETVRAGTTGENQPDLVVGLDSSFGLSPDADPGWRSFVIPLDLTEPTHAASIELRPNVPEAIAHATIRQDPAGFARILDELDPDPGFTGPETRLSATDQVIAWSPVQPRIVLGDASWTLNPGSDLVVDLYLMPTERQEDISFELAFEFQQAPSNLTTATLHASATNLEIQANDAVHIVKRRMSLASNCKAVSILPSAGPLCQEIKIYADVDGSPVPLVWIQRWDPQFQREYHFREPIQLKENTVIVAEFTFNNSPSNDRSSGKSSQPARWGLEPNFENAEFWLRLIPDDNQHLEAMRQRFSKLELEMLLQGYQFVLSNDPEHFEANARMGHMLVGENQGADALPYLEAARATRPNAWNVLHNLGLVHVSLNKFAEAETFFASVLSTQPDYAPSRKGHAVVLAMQGKLEASVPEFEDYLKKRPTDYEARNNLGVILAKLDRKDEAESAYRRALEEGGSRSSASVNLANLLATTGRGAEAIAHWR